MRSRDSSRRSAPTTSRRSPSSGASDSERSAPTGTKRTARSSSSSCVSSPAPKGALDGALGVALGDVAALIALLLAPRECDLELRAAVLEVEAGRHERQPLLVDGPDQGIDLAPVQEELPVAVGVVVGDVSLCVLVDVGADEPDLAVADVGIRLGERDTAVAERLDLRSGQL